MAEVQGSAIVAESNSNAIAPSDVSYSVDCRMYEQKYPEVVVVED
jgi:hypothetical protein